MAINKVTTVYPKPDHKREGRLVSRIQAMMHDPGSSTETEIKEWIKMVLADVESRRPGGWWFCKYVAAATLTAGQDVIDLKGHLDKVCAVFAPARLNIIPLGTIVELRQDAQANSKSNGGDPGHYGLQAGRRVHLWPAPADASTPFAVLYTRPLHVAILPNPLWELLVYNGLLGMFGQHFDRDALTATPSKFEARYERQLRRAAIDNHDTMVMQSFAEDLPAGSTVTADSSTGTATSTVVPASLSGIGFLEIETGDYQFEVS